MKRFILSLVAAAVVLVGATAVQAQVPVVTYYAPSTVYYSTPVTSAPTVTYYRAPAVTYYRTPTMTYYPSTPVVTRYRPLLNRTVVRYPYGAPVVYYP